MLEESLHVPYYLSARVISGADETHLYSFCYRIGAGLIGYEEVVKKRTQCV